MSSQDTFAKCFEALKDKYREDADSAQPEWITCFSGEYYISLQWEIKPTWRLSMEIDGSPVSAAVHAVSDEILEVK